MAKTPVKQGASPEFNCKAAFHIKAPEKATVVAQVSVFTAGKSLLLTAEIIFL